MDRLGFRAIEPDRIDRAFDLTKGQLEQHLRRVPQRKEPSAGCTGGLILGSQAEKTGDEDAKGVAIRLASDDANDRFLPLSDLAPDNPESGMDLLLAHGPER